MTKLTEDLISELLPKPDPSIAEFLALTSPREKSPTNGEMPVFVL
jgi:hypothetical protein